jgi:hypothetical protein
MIPLPAWVARAGHYPCRTDRQQRQQSQYDGDTLSSIGDLAQRTGLSVRTVRFYSDRGGSSKRSCATLTR